MAPESVAPGTAVSLEHEDALLLGEVILNVPKPTAWHLDIRVEQVLNGLMNLMALRASLLDESRAKISDRQAAHSIV
jgi:hypothetical protein